VFACDIPRYLVCQLRGYAVASIELIHVKFVCNHYGRTVCNHYGRTVSLAFSHPSFMWEGWVHPQISSCRIFGG
jgi:hypothetical protein